MGFSVLSTATLAWSPPPPHAAPRPPIIALAESLGGWSWSAEELVLAHDSEQAVWLCSSLALPFYAYYCSALLGSFSLPPARMASILARADFFFFFCNCLAFCVAGILTVFFFFLTAFLVVCLYVCSFFVAGCSAEASI